MWTPERIESLLNSSDLAVERSIVVLYDRQTNDEKRDSDTKHTNKRGFRANHAAKMSYFARIILKGWKQDRNKNRVHLNPYKLNIARGVALQYTRQLSEQANEKESTRSARPSREEIDRQEDVREHRKASFLGASDEMSRDFNEGPAMPKKTMSRDELRIHRQTHTSQNSWWMNDVRGIPLCRVCDDCIKAATATYRPEVTGESGNYEDVVEEQIEADE